MKRRVSNIEAFAFGLLAFAFVGILVTGLPYPPSASAGIGAGEVDAFQVTCATTATEIKAPSGAQYSLYCQNSSTTAVYFGDNDISTSDAPSFCDGCSSQEFGGAIRKGYCLVASGTQTIECLAQVAAAP